MTVYPQERHVPLIDLTVTPPLQPAIDKLLKSPVLSDDRKTLEALGTEESPRRRMPLVAEACRSWETKEIARILKTSGRLALEHQAQGLRFLFTFLEVKRPGVEVLGQLSTLASLERVSLRVLLGTWDEGDEARVDAVQPIRELLAEAQRFGILDAPVDAMLADPERMRGAHRELKRWFRRISDTLERGETLTENDMQFLTQLCQLEINLMERRVSRLASRVVPYDGRSFSRLMPVLSFYDQDIEHLKNVVGRLATYKPFYERLLSMEHALSGSEMDRLEKHLLRDDTTHALGRLVAMTRHNPVLDRELAFLTSAVYQVALLRHEAMPDEPRPDLMSIVYGILMAIQDEPKLHVAIEPDLARKLFPTIQDWGFVHLLPDVFVLTYREEWAGNFVLPDGTPSLPDRAGERPGKPMSIRDLILRQMSNDAFIVGLLENSRVTSLPGIVPMIATQTRSVRVLDKILSTRDLLTGPANKEVPRLNLTNPARVPMLSIKGIINVRYISRVDLERLGRPTSDVRPEVRTEIARYLELLRKH